MLSGVFLLQSHWQDIQSPLPLHFLYGCGNLLAIGEDIEAAALPLIHPSTSQAKKASARTLWGVSIDVKWCRY